MTIQDWFEKRKEAQIQRRALEARAEVEKNPDLWTKCVHCDTCISVCPVCNIAADLSDLGRCIGCAACVRFCPQSARSFKDEGIARVAKKLEETCSQRRSPKFFL